MTDRLTQAERSRNMRAIRGRDTKPELIVRRLVHRMGFRFRLHRHDLPGRPDLVFPRYRKIIQVQGCFWHKHGCSVGRREPKSNVEYWTRKRERNADRDRRNRARLVRLGWRVLTVWECQLQDRKRLSERVRNFLGGAN